MRNGTHGLSAWLVVGCLVVGGTGCVTKPGEEDRSRADTKTVADGGTDTGVDGRTDSGRGDGGGDCEPITSCPSDACGRVKDGCGGTIQCGTCPCENGVAKEPRCGECGLGVRQCGTNETGPGTCVGPDLPGRDEESTKQACRSGLVFVDQTASSSGKGTKKSPYQTYAKAVSAARSGQTIIVGGKGPYTEQLEVKQGVSVVGGFSGAPHFEFVKGRRAKFEVGAKKGKAVVGLRAETIQSDTVVANVKVTTADAKKGQNNYGAYVVDSSALTLREVHTEAGKGGNGADGKNGTDGADGKDGKNAPRTSKNTGYGSKKSVDNGGKNSSCPKANAGGGGIGARRTTNASGTQTFDYPAEPGESSRGGANGGAAGQKLSPDGEDGANGASPGAGRDGSNRPSGGTVQNDKWKPEGGGEDGEDGKPGIGGGGGGGAYYGEACQIPGSSHKGGPAGAGGGAGGCGGEGGEGGEPGDGSFGLFLVRSDVELIDSSFRGDFGGVGGDGGDAGIGGRGGQGGAGGNVMDVQGCPSVTLNWSSGDGGNGGDGADGGHGAGGAGGVSYGAYCFKSSPKLKGETRFTAGGKANGGQSLGNPGRQGLSKDAFNCQ